MLRAVHAIVVLFHVPIVSYPHMTNGTVVLELDTQLRDREPVLPAWKAAKKSTASNERLVHDVFALKNRKVGSRRLTNWRIVSSLRARGTDRAVTTQSITGTGFYMQLQVTPAKELTIAQTTGRHACLRVQFRHKRGGVMMLPRGEVLMFEFTVYTDGILRYEKL